MHYTIEQQISAFWNKVDRLEGEDACWLWNSNRKSRNFRWNGKGQQISRVAYEITHGKIEGKWFVLRSCENLLCVNPKHLYLSKQKYPNSSEKGIERFWKRVDKSGGEDACWLWAAGTNGVYGTVRWNGKSDYAHRVSYRIANGEYPNELFVLHSCDNPNCVNPKHLFLGTQQDNIADRERKGRNVLAYGERHGQCKLTDVQVAEIRSKHQNGESTRNLSLQYTVTEGHIKRIVKMLARTIPTNL